MAANPAVSIMANLRTEAAISHRAGMGYWNPFIAPVGICYYSLILQGVTFFFRHPPPGEADDRCTHAGDYDNKNNCQEKAYAALEIIQKSPDRYISYM